MSDQGQRADLARKNEGQSPDRPSVSAPEAADLMNKNEEGEMRPAAVTLTPGDEIPSFSPSAGESASKRREMTAACSGDTLTPGAVTAASSDVTESPEGGAEPDRPAAQQAAPSHPPGNRRANAASTAQVDAMPRWLRRQIEQAYVPLPNAHFVPSILQRPGMVVTPPVTRASGVHLEPVGQHELDDDAKIPEFLRRQGVTSLRTHAQPIVSDREPSEGSQADQPNGFVPRELRGAGLVTFPVTQSQAPASASVTPKVTAAPPVVGSICPTCHRRVPARLSDAERQRAHRARRREQGKPIVP